MNRQQRRAAERQQARQRAQRRVSPGAAWMSMKIAMLKSDMRDMDEGSKQDILIPTYKCLDRLQYGKLDRGDFIHLCELNSVAGEIAYQLQFHDETGQISRAGHELMEAAEALNHIGERQNRTGKYIATGEELHTLREAVQYLTELLNLAPRGTILSAMIKIRDLVDQKLNKPVRSSVQVEKIMESA